MCKVSIVVPVYNVENYLEECLESITNQTFADIEVICVDDGSTDSSLEILEEYVLRDKRFIVLKQKNKGSAYARNFGMSNANGKYLLFLDSDDVLHKQMVEQTVNKAEKYDADIVVYKAISFNTETGRKSLLNDNIDNFLLYQDKVFSMKDVPDAIFNSFLVSAWNKLYRRDFIENNNIKFQDIRRTNDLFFTNKSLALAKRIILLNKPLLFYRVGMQNNLQAGNDKTPLAFYEALCELKRFLDEEGIYTRVHKSFLNLALEIIFYNLNTIRTNDAYILVINKLRKEGFEFLGISNYKKLKDLNYIGYLQYKAALITESRVVFKLLYCCFKVGQYYKLTGLKNTVQKILTKR